MTYEIIQADVLEALKAMPDASIDAILTDPPYALGQHQPTVEEIIAYLGGARLDTKGDFMSKKWDLPSVAVWREAMRVLRPGAHVLAFGGTRMFDMLTIGVRAAGFEIRDTLCWLYGQGYAKSKRIERAISMQLCDTPGRHFETTLPPEKKRQPGDHICPIHPYGERWIGWGTSLKPCHEPVVLARAPLAETLSNSALTHGTGGLNVDGGRIGYASDTDREAMSAGVEAIRERGGVMNNSWKNSSDLSGANPAHPLGRWPANVALSHSDGCRIVGTRTEHGHKGYVNGPGGSSSQFSQKGTPTTRTEPWAGHPDVEADAYECVPDCPIQLLNEQSGDCPSTLSGRADPSMSHAHTSSANSPHTIYGMGMKTPGTRVYADNGGASRFFATFPADGSEAVRFSYTAKASRAEREFGCDGLPERTAIETVDREPDSLGAKNPRAGAGRGAGAVRERCAKCDIPMGSAHHDGQRVPCVDGGEHEPIEVGRGEMVRNHHPTVKPIALTRWLATLLLPPPIDRPRRILVLYCGSGSEMIGAMRAGWDEIVGVEREADYCEIARARLARWSEVPAKMSEQEAVGEARTEKKRVLKGQTTLF